MKINILRIRRVLRTHLCSCELEAWVQRCNCKKSRLRIMGFWSLSDDGFRSCHLLITLYSCLWLTWAQMGAKHSPHSLSIFASMHATMHRCMNPVFLYLLWNFDIEMAIYTRMWRWIRIWSQILCLSILFHRILIFLIFASMHATMHRCMRIRFLLICDGFLILKRQSIPEFDAGFESEARFCVWVYFSIEFVFF